MNFLLVLEVKGLQDLKDLESVIESIQVWQRDQEYEL